ncbi:MAG: DNA methyltransferase [Armatimonadota bacterium]|jgi:ParB family chromosome partitioning protein
MTQMPGLHLLSEATTSELIQFPIDEVIVGERARALDPAAVESLVESIEAVGLLHAIVLDEDGHLIAGLHRLEAGKQLGWSTIPAHIIEGDAEQLELVEIDENLIRAELTVLERAEHLARRRDLYETLYPEATHGHGPGRGNTGPQEKRPPGFAKATSSVTGQSTSTIRRHLKIVTDLSSDVRDLIRHTSLSDSLKELRKLSRLPQDEQQRVAERIGSGEVNRVWEAQKLVRLEDAEAKSEALEPEKQDYQVYHCHLTELHEDTEEQSVDLILTDPPYGQDAIDSYGELAEFAADALKSDGSLLVMTGQSYLPEILERMTKHLCYQWMLAYLVDAGGSPVVPTVQRRVNSWWKPVLWFTVDGYDGPVHGDLIRSGPKVKQAHEWQQDAEGMEFLIEAFSQPGDLVCDPFLGTGTTGEAAVKLSRRFVGCDADEDAVKLALARLSEVEGV